MSLKQFNSEETFYYFAYGSCMCPVDLQRTMGEPTYDYVVGAAILKGYRLGFYRRSRRRNCGALDVVKDAQGMVEGVLYQLPIRFLDLLDQREEVQFDTVRGIHIGGYQPELVEIDIKGTVYKNVRTYTVINKLPQELAPNDWYFNVVLRGAVTCGLTQEYCWKLFEHMQGLQSHNYRSKIYKTEELKSFIS
ncbi:MAG: gamma-glutamylcyclotransferase [Microcoleaceae cyanobacterium]